MSVIIKTEEEIAIMRQAGRITADVLRILASRVKPGMETRELNLIAEQECQKRGAIPSFKGYHGFPASACVSLNDEIVHGIPGKRTIKEGDIVKIDFGVIYDGLQGDAALSIGVGRISLAAQRLMEATEGALWAGIGAAHTGNRLGDISAAIQDHAEARGFTVVREYTGHAIGRAMHEDPLVPNFGIPGTGPALKKGMTLALEPMLNIGDWRTRRLDDEWTVATADGSLSAHFEHTIAITDGDAEVLTR
jgi:methionyl aminopeptidase